MLVVPYNNNCLHATPIFANHIAIAGPSNGAQIFWYLQIQHLTQLPLNTGTFRRFWGECAVKYSSFLITNLNINLKELIANHFFFGGGGIREVYYCYFASCPLRRSKYSYDFGCSMQQVWVSVLRLSSVRLPNARPLLYPFPGCVISQAIYHWKHNRVPRTILVHKFLKSFKKFQLHNSLFFSVS